MIPKLLTAELLRSGFCAINKCGGGGIVKKNVNPKYGFLKIFHESRKKKLFKNNKNCIIFPYKRNENVKEKHDYTKVVMQQLQISGKHVPIYEIFVILNTIIIAK